MTFTKKRIFQAIIIAVVILLILLVGLFLFYRFVVEKNIYHIENKYYGFEIKTPRGWFAESKAQYSEESIGQLLQGCQEDKMSGASSYEVGHFKFKSQKYPQNFNQEQNSTSDFPSGIILDVAVNCIPSIAKDKNAKYGYGDLDIGGEKALAGISDYLGSDKIKNLSFLHDGLQYVISEYIYLSSGDKDLAKYRQAFNEAISSFKFIK